MTHILGNKQTLLALTTIAVLSVGLMAMTGNTVHADKSNALKGLDRADENVHDHTPGGLGGKQDQAFHHGICQGGHDTTVFKCP